MDLETLQVRAYRLLPRSLQVRAVRHATPNFTVGSIVLLTSTGDDLLLTRTTYRNGWLPPGGFVRRGETPLQAATREVREELGLDLAIRPHHRVAFDVRRQGVTFLSVAVVPPGTTVQPRSAELQEVRWFPLDDLPPLPNEYSEGILAEDLQAIRQSV